MLACIVLAAGRSSRFHSSTSKILHNLGGKPVLGHVLDALSPLKAAQTLVVVSPFFEEPSLFPDVDFVVQTSPLGTGDAIKVALQNLQSQISEVIITCGDTPLITADSYLKLAHTKEDLVLLKSKIPENQLHEPYGRVLFHNEKPSGIIEYKDASPEVRESPWINAGVYKIKVRLLKELIHLLTNQNKSQEYYFTDILALAYEKKYSTQALDLNFKESLGINTRADFAKADTLLQKRWKNALMSNGVTLLQPETIRVSFDTKIESDVVIEPHVVIGPGVTIKSHATVHSFCYLEHCTLEEHSSVGPFAHLRGNSVVGKKASVGNFVELKATTLGEGSKAKHLTYLGDTTVGTKANIGAGTITANYNGFSKFKTKIGDYAHIGADSILVAPIEVGNYAMTAAGSVITENIPDQALAISRTTQVTKPEGAQRFRNKFKK